MQNVTKGPAKGTTACLSRVDAPLRPATMSALTTAAFYILILSLSACATNPNTAAEPPGTTFTSSKADPMIVQQIMADSAWLQKNRLPKPPVAGAIPQNEAACPEAKLRDKSRKQMLLPADLMTTMVMHDAKPWAYVRYDVDTDGTPLNVTVEASSGLKSFDRAAIETVTSWRFELLGGLTSAHGCVSEVAIT